MNPLALTAPLVMGLVGSGHCVAMCGAISTGVAGSGALVSMGRSRARAPWSAVSFHVGRLFAYAALGAVGGALGHALPIPAATFALRLVGAVALLLTGLQLLGRSAVMARVERLGGGLWARLAPWARRLDPSRSPWHALGLGGLWAFMPCGLIYSALATSLAADGALDGALWMLSFGVGTLPALLTLSLFAGALFGHLRRPRVRHAAGLSLTLIGVASLTSATHDHLRPPLDRTPCGCPRTASP